MAVLDAQGNPVVRRGYGAYGGLAYTPDDPAQMTGAGGAGHPFGYTGRRWGPAYTPDNLQLYDDRARWYDPQLGTFLQTDPIGAEDYINLYSYVELRPGNAVDPTGKWMCTPGTSSQDCNRINRRIQGIASTRDQYPRDSREYRDLDRAYRVYGQMGERNGVWVGLEDLGDDRGGYAGTASADQMEWLGVGAQFLGAKQRGVIMDRSTFDSPWKQAGYPTVSAEVGGIAALAHEGYHIWQFASGTMPNLSRMERERQAYRVQTDVYRARWGGAPRALVDRLCRPDHCLYRKRRAALCGSRSMTLDFAKRFGAAVAVCCHFWLVSCSPVSSDQPVQICDYAQNDWRYIGQTVKLQSLLEHSHMDGNRLWSPDCPNRCAFWRVDDRFRDSVQNEAFSKSLRFQRAKVDSFPVARITVYGRRGLFERDTFVVSGIESWQWINMPDEKRTGCSVEE